MSESKNSDEDYGVDEAKMEANAAVLKRAMQYCWSENFLGRFRRFFTDKAYVFEDHAKENMAVSKTEVVSAPVVEHTLPHMECFQEYDNAEFYQQLLECQQNPNITPEETLFIQCLLASADYDSFYSVMVKEAKKLIIMKNAGREPEDVAESKGADDGDEGGGEKGSK
ncbi:hypothetical protein TeGR_g13267 [Tetraparma gracilis]|uniref:BART domain-containing protein n=1 Tax=Tetraparma gracilis TaxID=2962635 RepID=A0ABQ6MCH3_9STRA|nr:hypothetical protein TeGR_g13267 [Tetraparma gracilis]